MSVAYPFFSRAGTTVVVRARDGVLEQAFVNISAVGGNSSSNDDDDDVYPCLIFFSRRTKDLRGTDETFGFILCRSVDDARAATVPRSVAYVFFCRRGILCRLPIHFFFRR